jgi:hypothetical protein
MGIITSINQYAFIKGRFILESVVTAHESFIQLYMKKRGPCTEIRL